MKHLRDTLDTFKVTTTEILVPFLLPFPCSFILGYSLTVGASELLTEVLWKSTRDISQFGWTWFLSCLVGWSIVRKQRDWALNGLIKLTHRAVLSLLQLFSALMGRLDNLLCQSLRGWLLGQCWEGSGAVRTPSIAASLHISSAGSYLTFNLGNWVSRYKTLPWQ